MAGVTVVIPNWNGARHLGECLSSLQAQMLMPERVVLVDNGSTDDSLRLVRDGFPAVEIVETGANRGFSAAVNAGIGVADTEYVALLNNDTAAEPGWLEALVGALDAMPDYDIAASLMLLYHEHGLVNAAGDIYRFRNLAGENRGLGRPEAEFSLPQRVFGACAGAALYRREVFGSVGLFDEDFFLMYEDVDFSLRCLIAGKKTVYAPAARVRHKLGATIATAPSREMQVLAWRNQAIVVAQDLPMGLVVASPLVWVLRLVRETLLPMPGGPSIGARLRLLPARLRAQVTGFRTGLAGRGDVWRKRAIDVREVRRWVRHGAAPLDRS
jgi:GT2 family glycosyltransferase